MSNVVEFGIRVKVDRAQAAPAINEINDGFVNLANTAKTTGTTVTGAMSSAGTAVGTAAQAVAALGETEEQAAARIRAMVAASTQQTAAMAATGASADQASTSVRRVSDETANYANIARNATAQMNQASRMAATSVASSDESERYVKSLQRQFDLVGLNVTEQAQYRAAMLGGNQATQAQAAAIATNTEALRQQIAAEQRSDQAATQFIAKLREQVATLGLSKNELLAHRAAQLGVADAAAPLIAQLNSTEESAGRTRHASAGVTSELIVLGHEAISGNFSRMPGSFMVLAQQMNIISLLTSPMTLGIIAAGAALVGLGLSYSQAHSQMVTVNNAMQATSNFAGVTQSAVQGLAEQVSNDGQVTIGVAKGIVNSLVESGRIGAKSLGDIAALSVNYAKVTKQEVDTIGPELVKIFSDPAAGAQELNKSMNFLDAADIKHIKTLQELGQVSEAQLELAQKLTAHLPDQAKNVTGLERVWNSVKNAISGANDEAGRVLNGNVTAAMIKKNNDTIADLQQSQKRTGVDTSANVAFLQRANAELQKQLAFETNVAEVASAVTQERLKQNKAQEEINKGQFAQVESLKIARELVAGAPDSEAKTARMLELQKQINAVYRNMDADSRAMYTQQQAGLQALNEIYERQAADQLNAQYQLGNLTKQRFDEEMTDNKILGLDMKIQAEQRLANVRGLTAVERQAHLDRIDQLQEEIKLARQQGSNAALVETKKSLDEYTQSIAANGQQFAVNDRQTVEALNDQINKEQQRGKEIGKTKAQIEGVKSAYQAQQVAALQGQATAVAGLLEQNDLNDEARRIYEEVLRQLNLQIEARTKLAGIMGANEIAQADADAAKKASEAWAATYKDVQAGLGDAIANGSESAWKKVKAYIVSQALSVPINFVGSVTASVLNPGAAQATGVSGAINTVSSATSLYNTFTGSTAGVSSTVGSGIAAAGNFLGSSSMSAFGAGFAAEGGAAITASETFAAAGMAAEASAASLGAAISAALPYVGIAIVAYKLLSKYFDDGPESDTRLTFRSNNTPGNISINERGNEGKSDSYIAGAQTTSAFGTFGVASTFWAPAESETVKNFVKTVGLADDALAKYLTATEKAAVTSYLTTQSDTAHVGAEGGIASAQAGAALAEVFNQRMLDILEGVEPGLSKLETGFQGTSAELATEVQNLLAYRAALRDSGQAVFGVEVTLQQIAALKTPTEATSAALTRIADEFTATNQVLQVFGVDSQKAFGATGLQSEAQRQQLILLSGGVSAFSSAVSSFAQTYFTDMERLAPAAAALNAQMATMGLAVIPTTRDQFKDLVDNLVSSGQLATEAGQKQFASLMAVQQLFAQVHPDETAQLLDVQMQAAKAANDVTAQAAIEARQHAEALKSMTPQMAAATQALWAAEAAAAKLANAQQVLDVEMQTAQARGDLAAQAAIQEKQHTEALKTMTPELAEATKALWAAQAAATQLAGVSQILDLQIQAAEALGDESLKAALLEQQRTEALKAMTPALAEATKALLAAQATKKAQDDLTASYKAQATATKAVKDQLSSFIDSLKKTRDNLYLGDLSPLTPQQKYEEARSQYEATLAAAMAGDKTAQGNYAEVTQAFLKASQVANASDVRYQADFAQVQRQNAVALGWAQTQVDVAQSSLDALKSQVGKLMDIETAVSDGTLSITQAINNLAAIKGVDPASTNVAAITSLYQSLLGRAPDAAGLQYWERVMANGASIGDIAKGMASDTEYKSLHQAAPQIQAAPAPVILDLSKYVGTSTAMLESALAKLQGEFAGLRADQERQTGALISSNVDATADGAAVVAQSVMSTADQAAYVARTKASLV